MTEDQLNASQAGAEQSHYQSDSRFNNRRSHIRLFPAETFYAEEPSNANAMMAVAQAVTNK